MEMRNPFFAKKTKDLDEKTRFFPIAAAKQCEKCKEQGRISISYQKNKNCKGEYHEAFS